MLPYPTKGEASPDEALAEVDLAEKRFPQFSSYIKPLKNAWLREKRFNTKIASQEVETRQRNRTAGETFFTWLQSLFPKQSGPDLPPSPFNDMHLRPEPTPLPTSEPEADSNGQTIDGQESETEPPKTMEENLETIRKYYESLQKEVE